MKGLVTGGSPLPPGVTLTATGVNVSVTSTTATAIDLCLFDDAGAERRIRLPERTGEVFHGHVAGVSEGARYGLRAHGPFAPERGLRFDANKLLTDPYALRLDAPFRLHPSLFAAPEQGVDSAPYVPKAIVTPAAPPNEPGLVVPWAHTVIYEAHVRGLTRLHPDVPQTIRGTFAALAHPSIVRHLTGLGVTTLELLPVAAWVDERHLPALGLTNYWGYNPLAFCAPDPRLAPGGWPEVRAATAALAAAGIETVLDVVFNHTGEGDELGPTLSLRGLDNLGFYRLRPDDPARYLNDAGTGNTLRLDQLQGVRLVTEAMRTWARRGGVAGFRFDLATTLARRSDGFDPAAPLLTAIEQDPELSQLKLIAEPWDCGPGGHQIGRFPSRWGEWNDRFRDGARRYWRGWGGGPGELATRLAGSPDLFGARHHPSRSVNYLVAHDGFTLADLVSYERKHNQANGEDNRDGADHNESWNHGAEGPTADPQVQARRIADQRALLATLFFARGTPMLPMGAELGHSQGGNNNAYAQDNAISWIDWSSAEADLAGFVAELARLRREHPALHADRFLSGKAETSPLPDVEWRRPDGAAPTAPDWQDPGAPGLQMILAEPIADQGVDRVAVLLNRAAAPQPFKLPAARDGHVWRVLLDSAAGNRSSEVDDDGQVVLGSRTVVLAAEVSSPRAPRGAEDAEVARLAAAAGIAPEWWSLDGTRHAVAVQTQRALLAAMALPAATACDVRGSLWRLQAGARGALAPVQLVGEGQSTTLRLRTTESWLVVEYEDGRSLALPVVEGEARLAPLPLGRHRLRLGAETGFLLVVPARAFEPESLARGERLMALSAQLYALRREGDAGIGDFTTLARLGDLARAEGAGLVALNPLHALFPDDRERASPYQPSSRRFIDPLYLDVAGFARSGAAGASEPLIDYPAVWAAKAEALCGAGAVATSPANSAAFAAFVGAQGQALADFAAFQVISEAHPRQSWAHWPAGLRDPASAEVAAFIAARSERLVHYQALQWLCDIQLEQAAARAPGLGLCRDLAVGAAPDGAEAWAARGSLALSASIGAPPDRFAPQGQVWGLPPPDPHRWRAEGYAGFGELLRANMRHAGALRIDHVLGLARLFWVPEGADGADGAYVTYPAQDLLGVLALESRRSECLVIGEDLGTVPEGFRDALAKVGVYGYSVLPFERDGAALRAPGGYPPRALACVSTHDLPPLAGWWEGADIDERVSLGLLEPTTAQAALAERSAEKAELLEALTGEGLGDAWRPDGPFTPQLAGAIHAFVGGANSLLVSVQVDDLAGERSGVNLPGTDRERPNWRRRVAVPVEQLAHSELARRILDAVRRARRPAQGEPELSADTAP